MPPLSHTHTHTHTRPPPPPHSNSKDLDSGVIVGQDRTYGKGLVQNVEPLPFQTALKYTVAKYYTPSGACPAASSGLVCSSCVQGGA